MMAIKSVHRTIRLNHRINKLRGKFMTPGKGIGDTTSIFKINRVGKTHTGEACTIAARIDAKEKKSVLTIGKIGGVKVVQTLLSLGLIHVVDPRYAHWQMGRWIQI